MYVVKQKIVEEKNNSGENRDTEDQSVNYRKQYVLKIGKEKEKNHEQ